MGHHLEDRRDSPLAPQVMNDPHVEALHYSVKHAEHVDYDKARPLTHDTPDFTVRIENGRAEVRMKSHHATEEAARAEVAPFVRVWELTAALELGPGEFELAYDRATIIDREPAPGAIVFALSGSLVADLSVATAHVERSHSPDPPPAGIKRDANVDQMLNRYCRYHARPRQTTLADAVNFCITVLEKSGDRRSAAKRFAVARSVLNKAGELAGKKGGNEARKAQGTAAEFTAAEQQWLEEAMKRLIRRAAEVAGDPSASLPQITMADLPPL
jgi:hypothetical protein